jgi:hypothetical protein
MMGDVRSQTLSNRCIKDCSCAHKELVTNWSHHTIYGMLIHGCPPMRCLLMGCLPMICLPVRCLSMRRLSMRYLPMRYLSMRACVERRLRVSVEEERLNNLDRSVDD